MISIHPLLELLLLKTISSEEGESHFSMGVEEAEKKTGNHLAREVAAEAEMLRSSHYALLLPQLALEVEGQLL